MSVLPRRKPPPRPGGIAAARLGALINLVALVVAAVIGLAILFVLIQANPDNAIVSTVHDAARWLAAPFANLITFGDATTRIVANWGLAAIVYLVIGMLLGRSLVGRGLRWRR
jgi:hypothetical protein